MNINKKVCILFFYFLIFFYCVFICLFSFLNLHAVLPNTSSEQRRRAAVTERIPRAAEQASPTQPLYSIVIKGSNVTLGGWNRRKAGSEDVKSVYCISEMQVCFKERMLKDWRRHRKMYKSTWNLEKLTPVNCSET